MSIARILVATAVRTATRVGMLPDEILTYVEASTIDLLLIGVAADGKTGGWLGTGLAERVARRAPCLVLTVPDRVRARTLSAPAASEQAAPGASTPPPSIRTILIPVDFNRHAVEALTCGLALAEGWGAAVHVLHVYSPPWVRDAGDVPPPAELTAEVLRRVEQKLAADVSRHKSRSKRKSLPRAWREGGMRGGFEDETREERPLTEDASRWRSCPPAT